MARVSLDPPRGILFEILMTQMIRMVRTVIIDYNDMGTLCSSSSQVPEPQVEAQWCYSGDIRRTGQGTRLQVCHQRTAFAQHRNAAY